MHESIHKNISNAMVVETIPGFVLDNTFYISFHLSASPLLRKSTFSEVPVVSIQSTQ